MDKKCNQCGRAFKVPQEDLDFYKKIAVKIGG